MSIKAILFEKENIPTLLFFSGAVPVSHFDIYKSLKRVFGHSVSAGFLGTKRDNPEDYIIYGKSVSMNVAAKEEKNEVVTRLFHHGKIFHGIMESGYFNFPLMFISSKTTAFINAKCFSDVREISKEEYSDLFEKVICSVGSYK